MQVLLNQKDDLELDRRVDALFAIDGRVTIRYKLLRVEVEAPKPVIAMELVQPPPKTKDVIQMEIESEDSLVEKRAQVRKRKSAILTDEEKNYSLYNACRNFPAAVFRKHINLALIQKRSTSGLIILRPHECKKTGATNNQTFLTQVFSNLEENGNRGRGKNRGPLQPFLFRNLPSDTDLREERKLTPELTVIRGPGRPYGSFSSKKSTKRPKEPKKTTKTTKSTKSSRKQRKVDDVPLMEVPPPPTRDLRIERDSDEEDAFENEGPAMTLVPDQIASVMNVFDINSLLQRKWSCFLANTP